MNIVMLGHMGVGKTSHMACMYAAMSDPEDESEGFVFKAEDPKDHVALMDIAQQIHSRGHYPNRTDFRAQYCFSLFYQRKAIMQFTWTDYRGAALSSDDAEDLEVLMKDLAQADAILAFFDATELRRDDSERSDEVGRLTAILGTAVGEIDRLLPLSLVLTKTDKVDEVDRPAVLEPLEELIFTVRQSPVILGSLIETACGRGQMRNVEVPALYSLHRGILAHLKRLSGQIEEHRLQASVYRSRGGFFESLVSAIKGESSYNELADYRAAQAEAIVDLHNSLVDPVNALGPRLEQLYTF